MKRGIPARIENSVFPDVNADPTANPQGHKFPKTCRVTKSVAFERAYQSGQRISSELMRIFYLRSSGPEERARVGFTVGKTFGPAVERNRMKRRLRAATRKYLAVLPPGMDVVINPKKPALPVEFARLCSEIHRAFQLIATKQR